MSRTIGARDIRRIARPAYEAASHEPMPHTNAWHPETNYLARSALDWRPTVLAALSEILTESARANWDGEGAAAISQYVVGVAAKVLESLFHQLPKGTPVPDVMPEADGEICISWVVDIDQAFSMSVGDHGKVNFAGQFGAGGSVHAWQPIDTSNRGALEKSLQDVVRYVERLYPPTASVRAA